MTVTTKTTPTRRGALRTLAAGAAAASLPMWARYTHAQSAAPIRIGFQQHRTGIGAAYGRWYGRATEAAARRINEGGGINGRSIEIIAEDDGTDPKRGAEVIEKFANQHGCDGRVRHAVFPCRYGLCPPRGRIEAAVFRGLGRHPRGLGQAQPLYVAARYHRCEESGHLGGPVHDRECGP